jgi:hypothetical protein
MLAFLCLMFYQSVALYIHSLKPKRPLCHLLLDDIDGLTAIKPVNGLTVGQKLDKSFLASYNELSVAAESEAKAIKALHKQAKLETI